MIEGPGENDIVINEDLYLYQGLVPVYKGGVILDLDADIALDMRSMQDESKQRELVEWVEKNYGGSEHVTPDSPTMEPVKKSAADAYREARQNLFGKDDQ